MENTNNKLILDLFFEYGISVKPDAYDTHNPEQMKSLRKIVREDAIRFLGTLGQVFIIEADELVKSFFNKAMKVGLNNAGRKGWKD